MFLSQAPPQTTAVHHLAVHRVSIESAITSRETSEYFMPSCHADPVGDGGKPKTWGMAPAAFTAAAARSTSG